ncbi:hypothetical protein ACFPOE_06570 [Caenimonas terrae]|uniref:Uncharacterized protein n=1 Tax=Caenimonas terrae TaxID=696074 RepID=A0ABW0N944_9BURK
MKTALVLAVCLAAAQARAGTAGELQTPCPSPGEITQRHLLGLWRASFDGLQQGATLLLERHPELAESVRGAIDRDGRQALVAGDVDDGEFTLEESVDGVHIDAIWSGTVIDGSCGLEIRGDWQRAAGPAPRPFVLRKLP